MEIVITEGKTYKLSWNELVNAIVREVNLQTSWEPGTTYLEGKDVVIFFKNKGDVTILDNENLDHVAVKTAIRLSQFTVAEDHTPSKEDKYP